ncbi:Mitochondrial PGP phosphatase [Kalmanozyma brasiliensis GHG001]|uniref:Uncharacterized protein n=1 Tax=Kalmanozyma brasiliensis (strain GHG001) TaxID=1365824 RepID=V5EWF0_KALBG|nr:Mitochondrial PGP phosphatase [Kalmanozyma brasiliensis GHG001]EST07668.1 Mitochondrial PGP phosphatase [Kalmanozyma brasiliensis GHG001]
MANLAGVAAVFAVIFRPSLVVPHVQVPDIRHLDWEALHANGVRFLVFDKDNCLTAPHSDVLEPSITEAWQRCQHVFGRENILIVSNSSGSSSDPSGLGAESLSRALNVPVLCHKDKKPAKGCAREALQYFVALSYDRETTLAQAQHMPPGSASIEAGPSGEAKRYLKERRRVLSSQVPEDKAGNGSILLVGDRTMTDVVVAHRMNDELYRRRRRLGLDKPHSTSDAPISASEKIPPPQCISVLTTGIWTYEGRINAILRKLEIKVTRYLIRKGFQPGAPGLISLRKAASHPPTDWQKIAVTSYTQSEKAIAAPSEDNVAQFAYTGDRVPSAIPGQPTLGAILIATLVRPLPPRIASLFTGILSSRPIMWISTNLRDGWNVMIKGLEFGVREAGIQSQSRRSRKIPYDAATPAGLTLTRSGAQLDEMLPESKSKLKEGEVSASLACYIESRVSDTLPAVSGAATQLRNRLTGTASSLPTFSARTFLSPFSRVSPSKPAPPTTSFPQRTMHTSAILHQQPPPGANGPRPRVPTRNWIAAFAALAIVPASYYAGMRLHDLKDAKTIDPAQSLPPTPAAPSPVLHQHQGQDAEIRQSDANTSRALVKAHSQRKRELELTLFHLVREREDVLDKLERVHQRRLESSP